MEQQKKIQQLVCGMAEALLRYGAEISRVEETMQRVAAHFQVEQLEIFVITNGLFVNMCQGDYHSRMKLKFVASVTVNLKKLCDINELSRNIEEKHLSLDQALKRLEQIQRAKDEPVREQVLASALGAAAFCFLFGGSLRDCLAAGICGFVLWMLVMAVEKKKLGLSKVLLNILGGVLVTVLCVALVRLGVARNLDRAIMGAVIPLIPGVAFTNGIRDIVDGDYLSGSIRLLDALLIFCCIAVGVGIGLKLA